MQTRKWKSIMNTKSMFVATALLGISIAPAFAESGTVDPRHVDTQRSTVVTSPIIEGRQAAPLISPAQQVVIDRNLRSSAR